MPDHRFQKYFILCLTFALACTPFIALTMPRFLAFFPGLIGLVSVVFYKPVFGVWPSWNKAAILWPAAFLALMGLSSLWSITPDIAIERTGKTAAIFLGSILLFHCLSNLKSEHFDLFTRIFPLAVIGAGFLYVIELYGGAPLYIMLHPDMNLELEFNLSNLNRSVVFFILSAIVSFACLYHQGPSSIRSVQSGILALLLGLILYQTHSQSSHLALALGIIFFVFFPYQRCKAWRALAYLLIILVFAAPWIAQFLYDTLPPLIGGMKWFQDSYAADRVEIWDFIARRALEQPILGFGTEATRSMEFDTAQLYHQDNTILHPHNFALQIWIEFGVVGAILMATFLGDIIRRLSHIPEKAACFCLPLFFATLLVASTAYGVWQGWWLGTIAMMFGYSVIIVKTSQAHEEGTVSSNSPSPTKASAIV